MLQASLQMAHSSYITSSVYVVFFKDISNIENGKTTLPPHVWIGLPNHLSPSTALYFDLLYWRIPCYYVTIWMKINHIISYHIISYHIISYHIISYHIISYHIIYHIISYHPYLAMFKMRCGIPNAYILDITMYKMHMSLLLIIQSKYLFLKL